MTKTTKRVVALILTIVMLVSMLPMTVFAAESAEQAANEVVYENGKFGYNGYYNVISRKDYVLVPGAAVEDCPWMHHGNGFTGVLGINT